MWQNLPALDLDAYPTWLLPREAHANGNASQNGDRYEIERVNLTGHALALVTASGLGGLYRGHFGNGAGLHDRVSISGLSF